MDEVNMPMYFARHLLTRDTHSEALMLARARRDYYITHVAMAEKHFVRPLKQT